MSQEDPLAKFKALLEAEHQFPIQYMHKLIGKNSPIFLASVAEFEKKHIGLTRTGEKTSASGKHLSLTYEYHAASADEVIELQKETQKINDLIYII
jgi:putative lipoic acid-binding regulatory protein